jgi:putative ABC transport system permease protein
MAPLLDAIAIAIASIWANKLRSLMMVLGNIVAVMSIIAVVSLIQGMNTYVGDAIMREVGAGTFRIDRLGIITDADREEEARRRNPIITAADLRALRDASPLFRAVMAESAIEATIAYREVSLENVRVRGVSAEYQEFSGYTAQSGRLPGELEVRHNRPVVLVGWETAQKLFKGRTPVDEIIRVGGGRFRVVGVSEKQGSLFGQTRDDFAVIPLGQFQRLFGTRRSLDITVKPASPDVLDRAMEDARVAMRVRRGLRPRDADTFGLFTSDSLTGLWRQFSQGAFAVLIGIVSLSLVVGGIVIMNIMLMVVSERTREIGLRKALGARRRDIVSQVLTESTTLSVIGGVAGTALGLLAAGLIAAFSPLPADIKPWSVALGIGMTAIVGLFFGLYPALRAARLDPIEALRRE